MTIRIWYTVNVRTLANTHAAEVVRHWQHPLTHGVTPIWAGLFSDQEKALRFAQHEAALEVQAQKERDVKCACVTLGSFDHVE